MTDWELLRQYREGGSDEAFRKLAARHMRLVYSTCRRELGNEQATEDAVQTVFLLLARKASGFSRGTSIASWLFSASRFVCKDTIKSEIRRLRREEAAASMVTPRTAGSEWDTIEPLLNDALASLPSADRKAVLMRYCDGQSLREVADQIGTTEDAARKRVARAVEKLRRYFRREHATAQLLALDSLLLAHAAYPVPIHTQTAVMNALHNGGANHSSSAALNSHVGVLLRKGAFMLMDATTKKLSMGLAAAVVIGAIGVPITVAHVRAGRLAAMDTMNVIDATTPGSGDVAASAYTTGGGTQAADRAAIMATLRQAMEEFRRRDISHWANTMSSHTAINIPGRPHMSVAQFVAQQDQVFKEVGPFHVTATVQSLEIHGNTAQLLITVHFEATTVQYHMDPAGVKVVDDETERETWNKEHGRWLTSNVQVLSIRTFDNGQLVFQAPAMNQAAAQ